MGKGSKGGRAKPRGEAAEQPPEDLLRPATVEKKKAEPRQPELPQQVVSTQFPHNEGLANLWRWRSVRNWGASPPRFTTPAAHVHCSRAPSGCPAQPRLVSCFPSLAGGGR